MSRRRHRHRAERALVVGYCVLAVLVMGATMLVVEMTRSTAPAPVAPVVREADPVAKPKAKAPATHRAAKRAVPRCTDPVTTVPCWRPLLPERADAPAVAGDQGETPKFPSWAKETPEMRLPAAPASPAPKREPACAGAFDPSIGRNNFGPCDSGNLSRDVSPQS